MNQNPGDREQAADEAASFESCRLPAGPNMAFPQVSLQFNHKRRTIKSVPEAAEFLLMNWPTYEGAKLKEARQKCLNALNGSVAIFDARAAFIDAAKEAEIFIDYGAVSRP